MTNATATRPATVAATAAPVAATVAATASPATALDQLAALSPDILASLLASLNKPAKVKDSQYEALPNAFAGGVPLHAKITFVAANPKNPSGAAYARYAKYPPIGSTLAQAKAAGVLPADFLYDIRKGYIKVTV